MSSYRKDLGRLGENIACRFLKLHKYKIIDRNFRSRFGEIDIIARDNQEDILVFVEVKTRMNDIFGLPEESVVYSKQQKLIKTVFFYLQEKREFADMDFRIDVMGIKIDQGYRWARVKHIKNAITGA